MTGEQRERVSRLFFEVCDLAPDVCARVLDEACAGDADLRARVEALLSGDRAQTKVSLTGIVREGVRSASELRDNQPDPAPTHLGPYKVLKKIGDGGMGEVWLAEQTEPIRRRVALKIIKRGMDSKEVVTRFEAERQALAMMEHPCVAKVFDAGTTPGGRPYFAMEYVKGVPVTDHCDTHRLDTESRLSLFVQVCDGVQHAHQKAIIHRDLKPSNILVTMQAGEALPKIIDFGVAKATAQPLTERTMFTEVGVLIGTPEYMSPEQADLNAQDIDTRSDVYALGVILYQLLVGALPFEAETLRRSGFDGLRRMIRDEEPARPSARLATLGESSTESARNRRTDPSSLQRRLRGDLDWIVMKALEKDRSRRYGSPAELSADIGRHLRHEPVEAGPPGAAYRAGKFVRRHRVGVASAVAGVLVVVAFAVAMAVQAGRIAAERDRANAAALRASQEAQARGQVSEFLKNLFKVSDPSEARGNSITARELLDSGAEKIDGMLAGQPAIRAELMATMGNVYRSLGLYDQTEPLLEQALAERIRVLPEDHPDTLASMNDLATLHVAQGRYAEAEPLYLQSLETRKRVLGLDHPATLTSMDDLGVLYWREGRYDDAEPLLEKALAERRRVLGSDHTETLNSINNLANLYVSKDRKGEAEPLHLEALETRKRVLGEDHPHTLASITNLAVLYYHSRRFEDAAALDLEALEIKKRILGNDHPSTLGSRNNLANSYWDLGRFEDAQSLYLEILEAQRRVVGDRHPDTARTLYNLGCITAIQGDARAAVDWLGQAIEAGYAEPPGRMSEDADLASLHGNATFDELVRRARKNAAARSDDKASGTVP